MAVSNGGQRGSMGVLLKGAGTELRGVDVILNSCQGQGHACLTLAFRISPVYFHICICQLFFLLIEWL